jgi:hypothetical protein
MTKKVINNQKKEENTMKNSKPINSVLLTIIALILGVIAFNAATASKAQKLAMQDLSTLVGRLHSNIMAVNLTNEGRRVAAAIHFSRQTLPKENNGSYKHLLNHGTAGIEAYLAIQGGRDIVRGVKTFAVASEAYAFQKMLTVMLGDASYYPVSGDAATKFREVLAIKTYLPEVEKALSQAVSQLEAAGINGEEIDYAKTLATTNTDLPAATKTIEVQKND